MVVAATKQTGARTYLWVPIACNRPVWTEGKWTGWDLNPRPLPCQDSDLPADLPARPPSMRDSRLKPCPQRRRGFTWIQTGIAGRWSNALDGDTSPRRAYQNGRLEGRWMRHGPLRGGSSEVPPIAHEFQLRSHRLGQGMRAGSGIPPKGIPLRNSVDFPRRQTHAFASHRPGCIIDGALMNCTHGDAQNSNRAQAHPFICTKAPW